MQRPFLNDNRILNDNRTPARIQVECRAGGPSFSAESLNISRGGVFLQTESLLPAGHTLQLIFSLPEGPRVSAHGRVAWTRPPGDPQGPAGMGIQFESIAPEILRVIEAILEKEAGTGRPA